MLPRQIVILAGLLFSILFLANCSEAPPPPPVGGSGSAGIGSGGSVAGGTFNAEAFFNAGCQVCHSGTNAMKPLDDEYDGDLVEFVKEFPEHSGYQANWPAGADADALADYINTEVSP